MKELIFNELVVRCDPDHDTVWLSQKQMAELYGRDKANISRHVKNVLVEAELDREATVAKLATVQIEGGKEVSREVEFYNLDMVIAVGFRVRASPVATRFRQWAAAQLREILLAGRRPALEDREEQLWEAYRLARTGAAQMVILSALGIGGKSALPALRMGSLASKAVPEAEFWTALQALGVGLKPTGPWLRPDECEGRKVWLVEPLVLLSRLKAAQPRTMGWDRTMVRRGLAASPAWLPEVKGPRGWPDKVCFGDGYTARTYWVWLESALPPALVAAVG